MALFHVRPAQRIRTRRKMVRQLSTNANSVMCGNPLRRDNRAVTSTVRLADMPIRTLAKIAVLADLWTRRTTKLFNANRVRTTRIRPSLVLRRT